MTRTVFGGRRPCSRGGGRFFALLEWLVCCGPGCGRVLPFVPALRVGRDLYVFDDVRQRFELFGQSAVVVDHAKTDGSELLCG